MCLFEGLRLCWIIIIKIIASHLWIIQRMEGRATSWFTDFFASKPTYSMPLKPMKNTRNFYPGSKGKTKLFLRPRPPPTCQRTSLWTISTGPLIKSWRSSTILSSPMGMAGWSLRKLTSDWLKANWGSWWSIHYCCRAC